MKQLLHSVRTGVASVSEVPAPNVGPGQVLVRVAASLVSAGTERTAVEFGNKSLLQKAKARPDLVRQVHSSVHPAPLSKTNCAKARNFGTSFT